MSPKKKQKNDGELQKLKAQLKCERERQKEKEKGEKKVASLNNRNVKQEEAINNVLVLIGRTLIEECQEIGIELDAISAKFEAVASPFPTIEWSIEHIEYELDERNEVKKKCTYVTEKHVICKLSGSDLAQHIQNGTLNSYLSQVTGHFGDDTKLHVVVTGMLKYHHKARAKMDERLGRQASPTFISKQRIDEVVLKTQLLNGAKFRFAETAKDFACFVASFTKSIVAAPYKNVGMDTFLRFSNSSANTAVKISADGNGVKAAWNQQLQQFYGVRHDTAVAITQVYPTPSSLMKAYASKTEQEGRILLQDIEVRRGAGVLQTNRRVGQELSKKIHCFLTCLEGEVTISK